MYVLVKLNLCCVWTVAPYSMLNTLLSFKVCDFAEKHIGRTFHCSRNVKNNLQAKGSPIQEFVPLRFAFEGVDSASQRAAYQYLIVEPANYLIWDVRTPVMLKDTEICFCM